MTRPFSCVLLLLLPMLWPSLLCAKSDFKLSGRVAFQLESRERFERADLDQEAVLELETRRHDGLKAGVDARLTSDSGSLELREIYLESESDSGDSLLIGRNRKRFGLDWEYPLEERIGLERGIVNELLSRLSYAGRDTTIRFRPGTDDDSAFAHDLSFHTANGLNAAILYGAKWRLASGAVLASTTLGQLNRVEKRSLLSAAQSFAFSSRATPLRFDAEILIGEDHLETAYLELAGRPRTVRFSALQAMTALRRGRFEPFARTAGVLHDLSRPANLSLELAGGARFYFQERFTLGAQLQARHLRYAADAPVATEAEALTSLRYFF
ncbi:MAG: hypothetical protein NDJ89_04530 [Oligoflexia bacterium]|nr:hypothetical protein [Oligoflexia bacterium]